MQNGARRGHRVWTSYYNAKLMMFSSPGTQKGNFPPQTPKNHNLGDVHENDIEWVGFSEKGSPMVKIPLKYALYSKLLRLVHAKHPF